MFTAFEKITNELLSLPSDEKLILIDLLIKSLNLPLSSDIDKIWACESEKRLKELQSKKVKELDGELVFGELREKYNK